MKKSVYFLLPLLFLPPLQASDAPQTETVVNAQPAEREVKLAVKEMTCQLCVYLVNKELRALDGVISTKADMKKREVKIIAKESVSIEQMIEAVEKLGYSVRRI